MFFVGASLRWVGEPDWVHPTIKTETPSLCISDMATVGSLEAVKEGEEDEGEAEEEEVKKEEGAREFKEDVKEEGARELDEKVKEEEGASEFEGEATGEKVVVERKKNRWFAKLVYFCTFSHFHISQKISPDNFEKQVAGNSAPAFNGNFWDDCISVFEAEASIE